MVLDKFTQAEACSIVEAQPHIALVTRIRNERQQQYTAGCQVHELASDNCCTNQAMNLINSTMHNCQSCNASEAS
jgi:hypothetical protein